MKTQTTIAVLAGAAALAVAAVILSKNNNCSSSEAEKSSKKFRNKLSSLKRKAEKEYSELKHEAGENPAMERVNKWMNNPL